MSHCTATSNRILGAIFITLLAGSVRIAHADPSLYPQFAQQSMPDGIVPRFINVEELIDAIQAGARPMIFDVRSQEEFREAHILSAQSAPLADFRDLTKKIPRDRLVVLY